MNSWNYGDGDHVRDYSDTNREATLKRKRKKLIRAVSIILGAVIVMFLLIMFLPSL